MSKCIKVNNPCTICLETVTKKTGLQCKGACKKWAHYDCLHYSPGKIQDVKAGIITVKCPCPGCKTVQPKEYLTNPPYMCTNPTCPANKLPRCEADDCPTKPEPIPTAPGPMSQNPSGIKLQLKRSSDSTMQYPPAPCGLQPPCAKAYSSESSASDSPPFPIMTPCPVNDAKSVKKTKSCSCTSNESETRRKLVKTSSEMNMPSTNSLYVTVQEMCKTVGQLSTQIKQLMCKMMDTVENTR